MSKIMASASAPSRSTGTITLSWGLVNMSLSIYTGTEDSSLGRKEFVDGDPDRPAGRAVIDKTTGQVVDSSRIQRLAQADNGAWIEVTDEEMASIVGVRNVAEILAFVPESEALSSYVVSDYHQVRPHKTKGVPDPASSKAFALFLAVLTERGLMALVRLATRGPARYGLITKDGDFLYVVSTDLVRESLPLTLPPVEDDHMKVANQLVDAIGIGVPALPSVTQAAFAVLVNAKAAGYTPTTLAAPAITASTNMLDTLLKSVDTVKSDPRVWAPPAGKPVEVAEEAVA